LNIFAIANAEDQKVRILDPPARSPAQVADGVLQRPEARPNETLDDDDREEQHRSDSAGKGRQWSPQALYGHSGWVAIVYQGRGIIDQRTW
jgi:hypothetical protein